LEVYAHGDNTMNILAIVGSPRKGRATDSLVDKAIEGAKVKVQGCNVKKLDLMEYDIRFCKNCLACRESQAEGPVAPCTLDDDMAQINQDIRQSDALIFGTPVHMGHTPAIVMAFLERICWAFAKPEGRVLGVKGCPVPRSNKERKAIIIVTSGIVPPLYRRLCDEATPLIKCTLKDSLNARSVGDLYAGDIEHRGVEYYFDKAFRLGQRLV
jgi:NAD(P)H-dependent FMN reductase